MYSFFLMNHKDSKLMSIAMLFCVAPLLFTLFFRGKPSGDINWLLVAGIGVFFVVHVWLMWKGHGHGDAGNTKRVSDLSSQDTAESDSHCGQNKDKI